MTLFVVGTPIGHLDDLSKRAAQTLRQVDCIAAEDTRTARALLTYLGFAKPIVSFFEGNEQAQTPALVSRLARGEHIALISESGMPLVSDPGYRLVSACAAQGLPIEVVPGPSAVLAALAGSGLPTDEFLFVGFLPRKVGARRSKIIGLRKQHATLVLFESSQRLAGTLEALCDVLGDRRAVVARELTRKYEEFIRGSLAELSQRFAQQPPRGQITLVIEGASESADLDRSDALSDTPAADNDLRAALSGALASGQTPRDIYRMAVDLKRAT